MIFTVDVEDWSQSVLDRNNPVTERVLRSTHQVMDVLSENNTKATFFTLGNVAEKFPELIQRMVKEGHEVASHGYSHQNIYSMSPTQMREEISKSVKILEDAGGEKVIGFRAPNFSIREHLFRPFCEALQESGIRYDSSLFPMKVLKYGIEKKYDLSVFEEHDIDEFYLSYIKMGQYKLPYFGGGYFRLSPYAMTRSLIKSLPESAVFYMHPYEVDHEELEFIKENYGKLPFKWRVTQFVGRKGISDKLRRLTTDQEMMSFRDAYYPPGVAHSSKAKNLNSNVGSFSQLTA
jgi:polysaccharide deacetylase family protein (PEP-CTERM system associated)